MILSIYRRVMSMAPRRVGTTVTKMLYDVDMMTTTQVLVEWLSDQVVCIQMEEGTDNCHRCERSSWCLLMDGLTTLFCRRLELTKDNTVALFCDLVTYWMLLWIERPRKWWHVCLGVVWLCIPSCSNEYFSLVDAFMTNDLWILSVIPKLWREEVFGVVFVCQYCVSAFRHHATIFVKKGCQNMQSTIVCNMQADYKWQWSLF